MLSLCVRAGRARVYASLSCNTVDNYVPCAALYAATIVGGVSYGALNGEASLCRCRFPYESVNPSQVDRLLRAVRVRTLIK